MVTLKNSSIEKIFESTFHPKEEDTIVINPTDSGIIGGRGGKLEAFSNLTLTLEEAKRLYEKLGRSIKDLEELKQKK